jgi:hypothetical protein
MAKEITTKNGTVITLRNPAEKGKRFAEQLKSRKVKETGEIIEKGSEAYGYRRGYLQARRDGADAYNAKHNPDKLKSDRQKRKEARMAARAVAVKVDVKKEVKGSNKVAGKAKA